MLYFPNIPGTPRPAQNFLFIAATWLLFTSNLNAATRDELLAITPGPDLAGTATIQPVGQESFRQIVANAPVTKRARFAFGKIQFNTEWDPAPGQVPTNDGLGPVFNAIACAACHINNGRGRPPESTAEAFESILVRLSIPGESAHGGPKPLENYGGQLQHRAIDGVTPEGRAIIEYTELTGTYADGSTYKLRQPTLVFDGLRFGPLPADTMYSLRIANPIIGLGLLEAVPTELLYQLADPNDENRDGISGRINHVWSSTGQQISVGRFGWKANVATVEEQNAGASLGDMGITTSLNPTDNCAATQNACFKAAQAHASEIEFQQEFFEQLTRYVRLLAVPAQRDSDNPEVQQGAAIFRSIGCVQCHISTLKTGAEASHPELASQTIHPYTDLLLHDMGAGLADNRPDYLASGSEWRTAPLWGIGLTKEVTGHESYLHDGRARNLSEAILWHGGEALAARDAFTGLPGSQRAAILTFLGSL
ncbi:MAG: thiol oxidoreductase [Gammaproteobacteria bacterium]|nr:MAG: thiol oxidoreductase [Gammaproteobacteria bacterium]